MTREETKKAIEVMQAFVEGKKIQCCGKISNSVIWHNDSYPEWDFDTYNYRVKPEPHYRPFKDAEEVMEAIKEHGSWVRLSRGNAYKAILVFAGEFVRIGEITESCESAYENYVFADGTPFGKLED